MADRDSIRRAYDEIAEACAATRSVDARDTDVLTEFLASLSDDSRVSDAGCGQGTPVLRRLKRTKQHSDSISSGHSFD